MDLWASLFDILVLLVTALLLGAVCERFRQSAILGYLVAGTLLGPNALDLMSNPHDVEKIAELGVALLLFTIGLEFSWRKMRRVGRIALGGGTAQVVVTLLLAAGVCLVLGVNGRAAIAIGAMIALSSTAFVLRLLVSRAEIDGIHGRSALGILLLQDIAVVPLVLIVSAIGGDGTTSGFALMITLGRSLLVAAALVAGLFVVLNYLLPPLLRGEGVARTRDVPILLAIVTAIGSAWISHELGLSPVLGAFIAGLMLADSPFATQIHADVAPLRSLFVTLFFTSIGTLGNPQWVLANWPVVVGVVGAVVIGKAIVTTGVLRMLGLAWGNAVAAGLCLAQVGEFSFVLAEIARSGGLLGREIFELLIATTIGTLFLTPFLVGSAPAVGRLVGRWMGYPVLALGGDGDDDDEAVSDLRDHVVIVGFGPAGQSIAESLMARQSALILVIELNPRAVEIAQEYGLRAGIGDATQREVLEHARVQDAQAVVVTLPDPANARRVVGQVRAIAPGTPVVVRARYHLYGPELTMAGADVVVDEEREVGRRMATAVRRRLRKKD